jgi:hypothetical protein
MHRPSLSSAVTVLALGTSACGGPTITRDRDVGVPMPASATWSWAPRDTVSQYELDPAAQNPMLHQWVQAAIEREMQQRGFRQVGSPGEATLVVSYHIGIKRESELQTTTSGMAMGYGGGWYGGYGWGYYGAPSFATSTTREVQYHSGGLLMYIRDRESNRIAWRGLLTTDIHDPNHIRQEGVDRAVHETLGDLRAGS